jgi:hypothetical protein
LMIVMVAGALGSFIHTATSFGDFVGNNKLSTNWLWWYILRPFIGTALAAIFYLVIRGGFMSPGTDASSINLYGIVALAGLVGMFSKQATDKLGEVFTTMFKTSPGAGDAKRKDALANPVPTLTNIEPAHFATAAEDGNVVLTGSGFVTGSVTLINGSNRETKFKDSKTLTATLLPADLAHEGELNISVVNPPPGGGTSAPLKIRVGEAVAAVLAPGSTVPQGGDDSGDGNGSDGCDVEITSVTEDKDLPEARGGVAI